MQINKNHYLPEARSLDKADKLLQFKQRFVEEENTIYFDGNSLGRLPAVTEGILKNAIENDWGKNLIRSWEQKWMDLPKRTASKVAELLRVNSEEICIADNTSVNLYKLVFAALNFQKDRNVIITDQNNFPTDQYILDGLCKTSFPSHELLKLSNSAGFALSMQEIEAALHSKVSIICLSHVLYKSAFVYDMKAINNLAKRHGVLVVWDLSHSLGAVPLDLKALGCQLAVGCTYKFLNSGPGATAFLFIDKSLVDNFHNPIQGWFGHQSPFEFSSEYAENNGIEKFATGTPNILSMIGIIPGLQLLLDAEMESLRAKSLSLSNFLIQLYDQYLAHAGFGLYSPRKDAERGSHITLSHSKAPKIMEKLLHPEGIQKIFIPDFRPPNFIRVGIAPIYNTHEEVLELVIRLLEICEESK